MMTSNPCLIECQLIIVCVFVCVSSYEKGGGLALGPREREKRKVKKEEEVKLEKAGERRKGEGGDWG